ncbi:MAG: nucleotidyltransferase domain-containing protein [Bacteroidetes bacterium]|nr:nucleotidyltransferase domain-containing protein [Bacteroidota bacterium]
MQKSLPYILKSNLKKIQSLCRRYHVRQLWVFGSILTDRFSKESDIDFLYEWDDKSIPDEDYLNNLWALLDELEKLLGHKVDWIYYSNLSNPYFIEEDEATKVLLYDQQSEKVPV